MVELTKTQKEVLYLLFTEHYIKERTELNFSLKSKQPTKRNFDLYSGGNWFLRELQFRTVKPLIENNFIIDTSLHWTGQASVSLKRWDITSKGKKYLEQLQAEKKK